MASKIEIRFGDIELNVEGSEAFLSKEIPGFLRSLAQLSVQMRKEGGAEMNVAPRAERRTAKALPVPAPEVSPATPAASSAAAHAVSSAGTPAVSSAAAPAVSSAAAPAVSSAAAPLARPQRAKAKTAAKAKAKRPGKAGRPPKVSRQAEPPIADAEDSTAAFARRLGAKSCTDLARAAVAYLAIAGGRQQFERSEILSEMKSAVDLYRDNYKNNLFKALESLQRRGYVRRAGDSTFEMTPDGRTTMTAELARARKARK